MCNFQILMRWLRSKLKICSRFFLTLWMFMPWRQQGFTVTSQLWKLAYGCGCESWSRPATYTTGEGEQNRLRCTRLYRQERPLERSCVSVVSILVLLILTDERDTMVTWPWQRWLCRNLSSSSGERRLTAASCRCSVKNKQKRTEQRP